MDYNQLYKQASELANSGKHKEALKFYKKASLKKFDNYDVLQGWAGSLTWIGRFKEALQLQITSASCFPDRNPDYFVLKNRVKSQVISQNDEDLLDYAIEVLHVLVRLLKFNFYANDFLAEMLILKGEEREAMERKYFATICNAAFSKSIDLNKFDQTSGKMPDFMVIGPQKTATTALYSFLIQSPDVFPSINKELFYFNGPGFKYGEEWYKCYFPKGANGEKVVTGEATATYFNDFPIVAERIKEYMPNGKIIFTFRDPAKRAISDYYMKKRNGLESKGLLEAIKEEIDFLNDQELEEGLPPKNFKIQGFKGYVLYGLYNHFLTNYRKHFDPDQLLIVNSEDLRDPEPTVVKVCQFLGVASPDLKKKKSVNVGDYPKDKEYEETMLLLNDFYNSKSELVGDY